MVNGGLYDVGTGDLCQREPLADWKIADAQQRFADKMNERMEIQVQRKFVLALIKGDFVIFFQCY